MTKIYQLYGAPAGGTTNSLAYVQVQRPGRITGVAFAMSTLLDQENVQVELSFASVGNTAANDPVGPLAGACLGVVQSTAVGVCGGHVNTQSPPMSVGVKTGDRLYLHTVVQGGGGTTVIRCFVHVEE